MANAVLALNAGSSSLKFGLFEVPFGLTLGEPLCHGEIEGIGVDPHLVAHTPGGHLAADRRWPGEPDQSLEALIGELLRWVTHSFGGLGLLAVGHRVVHGGTEFVQPVRLTPAVIDALTALTPLAPLHQPHSLAPIHAVAALRAGLPQVACFDTAFHASLPPLATRLPLPIAFARQGVRRYGFHGLSYEFISRTLRRERPDLIPGRIVVAHLGSGASLCALSNGVSIDTTMGFSALDGLMMGTRTGAIDPGALLYLLQECGLSAPALQDVLYRQSGLLGVSGISADMRVLRASGDPRARFAIDLFVRQVVRETAAMAASLGGLDGLVFTGGIGEHDSAVRGEICALLAWLGVRVDNAAPAAGATRISAADSRVEVHVIPTDEEATIARHVMAILAAGEAGW
jgi:acetate kinase